MSGIATFYRIPVAVLPELVAASVPKKRWFGAPRDAFPRFLRARADQAVTFSGSGWVFNTLLAYLAEVHKLDLARSEHDAVAKQLSDARGSTFLVLTHDHHLRAAALVDPSRHSEDALRDYYNELNEVDEPSSGKALADGLASLRDASKPTQKARSLIMFLTKSASPRPRCVRR